MKTLLLVGGGHSHIEVLRRFGIDRPANATVLLVSPESHAAYSGMLPGLVAGHYRWDECHVDLGRLCAFARAERVVTRIVGLDLPSRLALCADGSRLHFDLVSLDVGSTPNTCSVPGADQHTVPIKPVPQFLAAWERVLAGSGPGARVPKRIVIVGGGAGGVEVALAIRHRTRISTGPTPEVTLVTDELLPAHVGRVRRLLERAMDLHGLSQLVHRRVVAVDPGVVVCEPSGRVEADLVVWVTGAGAAPWLANSGVQTDPDGFVTVNACLQSPSHPFVFATGDAASLASGPVPKSGVYAVRQGPPLAENLRRALDGRHLVPYRPQRLALALISTGGRHAVASYGPLAASGRWVWLWKDRIDRAFVQRYAV